jgi:hypothetical protein
MTTPNLPQMDPGGEMTHNIPPTLATSPYTDLWFTASNVTNVDREMMGWLTAQGWQVVDVTYDETTSPPTPSYSMSKQSMNNWLILQELMFSLITAHNQGLTMNYLRYRDIVTVWNHAFAQSQQQYAAMNTKSNADVLVYMTAFTDDTQVISTQIGLARSEALAESDRVATQLVSYVNKLDEIEANYQSHSSVISTLLTRQSDALTNYLSAYESQLDTLDAEYSTHTGTLDDLLADMTSDLTSHITSQLANLDTLLTDYTTHAAAVNALKTSAQAVLTAHGSQVESLLSTILSDYTTLDSSITGSLSELGTAFDDHSASYETILANITADFTTHAATTRGLLTGLGTTELARINEEYDARLSVVAQNLVNRGFYSSALLNDEQERVERERSERIGKLNDDLAREKVTNEHQLFAEQDKMRARSLDGRDRLYGIQQDVLRYEAQSAYQLFGQLQGVRDRTLSAKQAVYGLKDQFTRFQVEVASNLESRLNAVRLRTQDSIDRIQALRDALSRAKLQNSSQTYQELVALRRQHIEGVVQPHSAKQDVYRNEASQRDKLLAQLNDAVSAVLDGRQKYSAISLQKGQYLCDLRVKLNVQMMEIAARRLAMRQGTSQAELELMKYQVDSRNNFLVGMFKVIQDREDSYPDLTEISKLAFSLGDAGSGWVSP